MKISPRQFTSLVFKILCSAITLFALLVLCILILHILEQGWQWLSLNFVSNFPSRLPHKAGIKSAIYGTIWILTLTALISIPLGVCSAIYLEEYAPKKKWVSWIHLNISNLAGVPSIVYGLLGLAMFARYLKMGQSVLTGAMTISLLVLPIIIISASKAIRAVPDSIREAAFAMGARRWQVILGQVLPASIPGILTGVILSNSRAIGESAPLLIVGALSYVAFVPESISDPFTTLPVQIFNWASRPQEEFHGLAGAGIIVLLAILFLMNIVAMIFRQKLGKYKL
ncbi:MAG: phosphate ABC transporter permease PstA [Bdellovibrionota bacterium]